MYSSDPVAFQWHLYTEGWGRSAPNRYDFSAVNQFAAPWMGNMPGWRAAGFWQYENDALDELGKRIFTGQFSTLEERNTLYEQATQMALDDSVRIWVATVTNSFPASNQLEGVTQDLVAGPRSPWTLREASVPGSSELTVGHLWVWTERTTWNPVGGFGDVYSVDIWRNLSDPPLWNHPFTGIPIPFRATYEVETAGPTGALDVHPDTVVLDPQSDTWTRVGSGVTATSKVTFDYSKYFQSKWHHGQPITMADVMYSIYQGFDIAYDDEKSRIEFAMAVTARPFLETYKGFRVLDENRLEVYVDFWHFEENNIASYASPAGSVHAVGGPVGDGRPWSSTGGRRRSATPPRRASRCRGSALLCHATPGSCATRSGSSRRGMSFPRASSPWAAKRWPAPRRRRPGTRPCWTGSTSTSCWSSATGRSC